ncbi:hypothetical protein COOONC_14301, partial [Cooperia oncophora]
MKLAAMSSAAAVSRQFAVMITARQAALSSIGLSLICVVVTVLYMPLFISKVQRVQDHLSKNMEDFNLME